MTSLTVSQHYYEPLLWFTIGKILHGVHKTVPIYKGKKLHGVCKIAPIVEIYNKKLERCLSCFNVLQPYLLVVLYLLSLNMVDQKLFSIGTCAKVPQLLAAIFMFVMSFQVVLYLGVSKEFCMLYFT